METAVNFTDTESELGKINGYCEFFANYASHMLSCAATCIRIKKNLSRMAASCGLSVDMIILSHHVTIVLKDPNTGIGVEHIKRIVKGGANFEINTRLSNLSWKVAEGKISIEKAEQIFFRIIHTPRMSPYRVMWLVVLANASFCYLFGGDLWAMTIVGLATLIGYFLKIQLSIRHWDDKLIWLICAAISSVAAVNLANSGISQTPEWAMAASVLYLIPGIPYINSVADCIDGHYLCAFGRFIHAVFLTVCIAIGLTLGMLLFKGSILM